MATSTKPIGEPRVNVLALNLALDEKYPKSSARLRLQDQAL
jgi:hypothetical protein